MDNRGVASEVSGGGLQDSIAKRFRDSFKSEKNQIEDLCEGTASRASIGRCGLYFRAAERQKAEFHIGLAKAQLMVSSWK
jgi:hypothetical protein